MVIAQTLFKHIKKRYGADCAIDIIAPKWSIDVADRMSEIRRSIALDVKRGEFGFGKRRALGVSLRDERYDRAIVTPITFKSALVAFFANIPIRSGFIGEARFWLINDRKKLDKKTMTLMAERYLALDEAGAEIINPSLYIDLANQAKLIERFSVQTKPIAFFIGAEYGEAKRWSPKHFSALAKALNNKEILLIGSHKDHLIGELIAQDNPNVKNLCGQTTIKDAIDLIAYCEAAIANDSGLMHIAAAVNTPIVAIYGSSTSDHTPPLTDKKAIVSLNLACSPCFKRVCPFGHTNCLNNITPEMVYNALINLTKNENVNAYNAH
jgi:heptosyltransferase-2